MTRDEIVSMSDGRELDGLIAYHVFGWRWYQHKKTGLCCIQPPECDGWSRNTWEPDTFDEVECDWPEGRYSDWDSRGIKNLDRGAWSVPRYSTNVSDAWEVVEKMIDQKWVDGDLSFFKGSYTCTFSKGCGESLSESTWFEYATAATMPLAVCRAALQSVLASEKCLSSGNV